MNRAPEDPGEYPWQDTRPTCAHRYLLPKLGELLRRTTPNPEGIRVLDLGCGNGSVTRWLADRGFDVVGVDPSSQGIERAREAHPDLEFSQTSAYDPLRAELGTFQIVVSLEVVEHLYDPRRFARTIFDVLKPGGLLVLSTPYHGWLKNVTIALLGRFDDHVDPLRVHGHIKFWSRATLSRLLEETGFQVLEYRWAGRIRFLAKSMLALASRPADDSHVSADSVADEA